MYESERDKFRTEYDLQSFLFKIKSRHSKHWTYIQITNIRTCVEGLSIYLLSSISLPFLKECWMLELNSGALDDDTYSLSTETRNYKFLGIICGRFQNLENN